MIRKILFTQEQIIEGTWYGKGDGFKPTAI
jgi:hypothetical protein